jgi:glucan 1,3-beta-glucosidase
MLDHVLRRDHRRQLPIVLVVALLLLKLSISTIGTCARLYGVNYSIRNGPDWYPDETRCKSIEQVTKELKQLQVIVTDRVRIYSMTDCNTADIVLNITQQLQMEVWLGIWVGPNQSNFDNDRSRMLELMNTYDFTKNVIGIHVSSESIYRGEITVDEAIALRNTIKDDFDTKGWSNIPVTVADIIDTNIEFPNLITVDSDVVTFNQFPFWENTVDITNAAEYMSNRVQLVENQAGGRQIIVTETGWADAGSHQDANVASPSSMTKWLQDFVCLASSRGWFYFWFDAYDSDWKRLNDQLPNDVEGHFGTLILL